MASLARRPCAKRSNALAQIQGSRMVRFWWRMHRPPVLQPTRNLHTNWWQPTVRIMIFIPWGQLNGRVLPFWPSESCAATCPVGSGTAARLFFPLLPHQLSWEQVCFGVIVFPYIIWDTKGFPTCKLPHQVGFLVICLNAQTTKLPRVV